MSSHQPPKPGMRVVHAQISAQIPANSLRVQQALLRLLTPGWEQAVQRHRATVSLAVKPLAAAPAAQADAAAQPNPNPAA